MERHIVLAYCPACRDVKKHLVADPGSCRCQDCGASQNLVRPLAMA